MGVLLGNFVQSFRQAAQMVTVCGKCDSCVISNKFIVVNIQRLYEHFQKFLQDGFFYMCISKGRPSLLPVVGHSNFTTVWKLHPGTLRFQLSGPLPYDKVSTQFRTKVLNHVNFFVGKSFSKRQWKSSSQC